MASFGERTAGQVNLADPPSGVARLLPAKDRGMTSEARYHQARLACHRAWASTQPQYVIPGVLEEVDARTVGMGERRVHLLEPAVSPEPPLPHGGLVEQTTGPGATFVEAARRGQRR